MSKGLSYWLMPQMPAEKRDNEFVLKRVAEAFKVDKEKVISKTREREFVDARRMLCFILHKKANRTSQEVSQFINCKKDHATVLYHCKQAQNLIETDKEFNQIYQSLKYLCY